jgi:hypothetical protein
MTERVKPMTNLFEEAYPNIARWVIAYGWIEIGQDDYSSSFVRALDEGGMVWEGSDDYETLDDAIQALEAGLAEWVEQ